MIRVEVKSLGRLAWTSAVLALALPGCISLNAGKHTYTAASAPVRVNGADIRMQVKPEGTDGGSYVLSAMVVSAAVATFDGPFFWRIEASGNAGEHESLVIHRIHTRTGKTRRSEWYPANHLGKRADFRVSESKGCRAVYPIPGLLVVKPRDDGALEVSVDMTVNTRTSSVRKVVKFRMSPSQKRQDEFIFLPAEIVNNIGKSPSDWEDPSWD